MNSLTHQIIDYSDAISMHFEVYTAYEVLCERHWHQGIEIIYILDGAMKVSINNDKEFLLEKNHFSVINSMEIHSTKCIGETTVLLLQIPHRAIPTSDRIDCHHYHDTKFCEIFDRLIKVYQEKQKGYYLEFNSIVFSMLHQLFVQFGQTNVSQEVIVPEEKDYISKISQVIDYVQVHYMEPICLDDVSQIACYNKQYFTRIFKKHMKTTFLEYLNEVRIRHIFDELIYTDVSISEIAERNGFTNNKNFQKVFRKSYGCTPSEMRKKYRENNYI